MGQVDPDVNYFNNYTGGFTRPISEHVFIEEFNSIGILNNTVFKASLLKYNTRSYHAKRDTTFDAILKSMIKLSTFIVITHTTYHTSHPTGARAVLPRKFPPRFFPPGRFPPRAFPPQKVPNLN